jgi:O-glycosyl hydrolase
MPESDNFNGLDSYGNTCMTDQNCSQYVGGNTWHDYDLTFSAPDTVSAATNPWASSGKRYWETEVSTLGSNVGPDASGCTSSGSSSQWCPGMTDALMWAAIIDNRIAVENANAWLYWLLITPWNDNEGLMNPEGAVTIASRAYVMGNYSKFVRPGWMRIDATHVPTTGVTVSAYKNPVGAGNFAIVATNYNSSNATVSFSLDNFTADSVTPWLTSSTSNLTAQASITVSGNSFSATLPAQSVTTFVGASIAPPTNLKAVPH